MKKSEDFKPDELLKEKLGEKSAAVPDFVWDRIEAEILPQKKKRRFFWWFLLPLLAGGIIFSANALVFTQRKNDTAAADKPGSREQLMHSGKPDRSQKYEKENIGKAVASDRNTYLNRRVKRGKKDNSSISENSGYRIGRGKSNLPVSEIPGRNAGKSAGIKSSRTRERKTPEVRYSGGKPEQDHQNTAQARADGNSVPLTGSPSDSVHSSAENFTVDSLSPLAAGMDLPFTDKIDAPVFKKPANDRNYRFEISAYAGISLFDIAVFKDYFTSGQISNRTFASSGYETGLQAQFNVKRFGFYAGAAFNKKSSGFVYDVAVKESDYFSYTYAGGKVPLSHIEDDGANSCYIAGNVTSAYTISTVMLSAGTRFAFIERPRFSVAADLRFSVNLQSAMNLEQMTQIEIAQPGKEKFSYFQPGAGLQVRYFFTERFAIGLNPVYSRQYGAKSSSFYRNLNEFMVPLSVHYRF